MASLYFNAEALTALRILNGLTQVELARSAGISQSVISELESGTKRSPRPPTVKKIADVLGVPVAALLTVIEDAA